MCPAAVLGGPTQHWLPAVKGAVHASVNASTFYIVCVLVAFLSEVCLELVLARPTWERILLTLLIWMNPGYMVRGRCKRGSS